MTKTQKKQVVGKLLDEAAVIMELSEARLKFNQAVKEIHNSGFHTEKITLVTKIIDGFVDYVLSKSLNRSDSNFSIEASKKMIIDTIDWSNLPD